jgi:hypothetical protein
MKTKKNQKPTDYDIHLQYRCPECCNIHWLSLLETSTKNFKVVCDCGCVFSVKRTTGFKLKYITKQIKPKETKPPPSIPEDLLNRAIEALLPYGFTKNESKELLSKAYANQQTNDIGLLIKNTLEILRNEHCTTI